MLFYDEARPDQVEQLLLGDQSLVALGQHEQQIEGATAQGDWLAAHPQHPFGRMQFEVVEAQRFGGRGRWQEVLPDNGRSLLEVVLQPFESGLKTPRTPLPRTSKRSRR